MRVRDACEYAGFQLRAAQHGVGRPGFRLGAAQHGVGRPGFRLGAAQHEAGWPDSCTFDSPEWPEWNQRPSCGYICVAHGQGIQIPSSAPGVEGNAYHQKKWLKLRELTVVAMIDLVLVAFPHEKGPKEEQQMTARRGPPWCKCTVYPQRRALAGNQSQTCQLDLPQQPFLLDDHRGYHHRIR